MTLIQNIMENRLRRASGPVHNNHSVKYMCDGFQYEIGTIEVGNQMFTVMMGNNNKKFNNLLSLGKCRQVRPF